VAAMRSRCKTEKKNALKNVDVCWMECACGAVASTSTHAASAQPHACVRAFNAGLTAVPDEVWRINIDIDGPSKVTLSHDTHLLNN
jgi:hypothetical protein